MMIKQKSLAVVIAGAALMMGAGSVSAHEKGDMILRAGLISVNPQEGSSELALDGGDIAGSEAGVDNNQQLGLTLTYMLSNHFGLELLAATPFDHDVTANTGALGLGRVDAGSIHHLPPSLMLQYYPLESSSAFQPYVGFGVNYTLFFKEDVASQLESVLGPGSLELDDSFGLTAQVGFDYQINDNLLLNAAVRYIDIDTDATFKFDSGSVLKADVSVDPIVPMISLSYKF